MFDLSEAIPIQQSKNNERCPEHLLSRNFLVGHVFSSRDPHIADARFAYNLRDTFIELGSEKSLPSTTYSKSTRLPLEAWPDDPRALFSESNS